MTENFPEIDRHEFETVSSELLYEGKILALRKDQVRMPGGNVAPREVVEHFAAVAVAAVDDEGRIALIHQYRHPVGRRLWELPAGLMDFAGEAAQPAAARELLEETGLVAEHWSVLADVALSPGFTDEVVRVFLARGLSRGERPPAHDEELDVVLEFKPLSDAVSWVFSGQITNATAATGILAAKLAVDGAARSRPADAPWPYQPTAFARRQAARGRREAQQKDH
jgi:ADP-ribose pyrophosphatase